MFQCSNVPMFQCPNDQISEKRLCLSRQYCLFNLHFLPSFLLLTSFNLLQTLDFETQMEKFGKKICNWTKRSSMCMSIKKDFCNILFKAVQIFQALQTWCDTGLVVFVSREIEISNTLAAFSVLRNYHWVAIFKLPTTQSGT